MISTTILALSLLAQLGSGDVSSPIGPTSGNTTSGGFGGLDRSDVLGSPLGSPQARSSSNPGGSETSGSASSNGATGSSGAGTSSEIPMTGAAPNAGGGTASGTTTGTGINGGTNASGGMR
jgi:hypothetical protein